MCLLLLHEIVMGVLDGLLALDCLVLESGNIPSTVYVGILLIEAMDPVLHVLEEGFGMGSHFVDLSEDEQHQLF